MTRSEEALQLAREIFELETKLEHKRREHAALVGENAISAILVEKKSPLLKRGATQPGSVADQIKKTLEANSGIMTTDEIVKALPNADAGQVTSTVSRLAKDKLSGVHRKERAHYYFSKEINGIGKVLRR